MAQSRNNVITRTYSGKFGNVIMQRDGIIRKENGKPAGKRSAKQQGHHCRFANAIDYARKVVTDAGWANVYEFYLKKLKKKRKNIGSDPVSHCFGKYFIVRRADPGRGGGRHSAP